MNLKNTFIKFWGSDLSRFSKITAWAIAGTAFIGWQYFNRPKIVIIKENDIDKWNKHVVEINKQKNSSIVDNKSEKSADP